MADQLIVSNTSITAQQDLSEDLYIKWLSYLDATPKTVETYTRSIRQFFVFLNDQEIKQPTRETILEYRENLKADHKPSTVQIYMVAVRLFFRYLDQMGLYPNIADHIKGAKLDHEHKKDPLTSNQTKKLLHSIDQDSLKGLRDYAIISLMVTTGLRTVSVIRANVEDLRTLGDDTVLYYQGKGHDEKSKYVKISDPVETAIRAYLSARSQATGSDPLFASIAHRNSGERMTTRSISRLVKDNLINAGYNSDRLTAHSLRHTTATLNLLNGGTVEETQQLLDHTNINTTMIYAHALERARNQSELRVSNLIFD